MQLPKGYENMIRMNLHYLGRVILSNKDWSYCHLLYGGKSESQEIQKLIIKNNTKYNVNFGTSKDMETLKSHKRLQ